MELASISLLPFNAAISLSSRDENDQLLDQIIEETITAPTTSNENLSRRSVVCLSSTSAALFTTGVLLAIYEPGYVALSTTLIVLSLFVAGAAIFSSRKAANL